MKQDLSFDGFSIRIFLDEDFWVAHFIEQPEISSFGASPIIALKELRVAWNETKRAYNDLGIPIPMVAYTGQKKVIVKKNTGRILKFAPKQKDYLDDQNELADLGTVKIIKKAIRRKKSKTAATRAGGNIAKQARAANSTRKKRASRKKTTSKRSGKKKTRK